MQYLELLRKRLRPQHAHFTFKKMGKDPLAIYKRCLRQIKNGDFDRAIFIVDVDSHERLEEALNECKNTSTVDAVVTNPCFELWLLWHATDLHGYTEVHKCAKLTHTHKLTKNLPGISRLSIIRRQLNVHYKRGLISHRTKSAPTLHRLCLG
ncbi:MAG: RloB domain-containing protein [Actinomyces sp.]|nr:RloB domain-containing protein [Actinomyces sp.]